MKNTKAADWRTVQFADRGFKKPGNDDLRGM
jgi:hypothetical protein